jgi:hypothetical protein
MAIPLVGHTTFCCPSWCAVNNYRALHLIWRSIVSLGLLLSIAAGCGLTPTTEPTVGPALRPTFTATPAATPLPPPSATAPAVAVAPSALPVTAPPTEVTATELVPTVPPATALLPTAPPATAPPVTAPPPAADSQFGAVFFQRQLNVTSLPCADLEPMGIRSTFFGAWMGAIVRGSGDYAWSDLDATVDAALACGVAPLLKVSAGANSSYSGPAPADLGEWESFCFALAEHYRGKVLAYAIENEIDKPRMAWTGEDYGRQRAAAYAAIKRADPAAYVLDSGLTESAYLVARADELQQAGQAQEALDMLARFNAASRLHGNDQAPTIPTTARALTTWLARPAARRQIGLVEDLRQHPETVDAIQLHFLTSAWEQIPEYVSWMKGWFPGKPVEFWETGYGYGGADFSEQDHANGVVKMMVSELGEGTARVIYEPYLEDIPPGATSAKAVRKFGNGLVTPDGPRLAATAYRTMAGQLSGYQQAERLDLGAGVWAYRFTTPREDVYVVWAGSDNTVSLPLPDAQVTVIDIAGGTSLARSSSLPAGTNPIFVTIP